MADYLPSADAPMQTFFRNLKTRLPKHQTALDITAAKLKDITDLGDGIVEALEKNLQRRSDYLAQTAATRELKAKRLPVFRAFVNWVKAQPGYTEEIGRSLGFIAPEGEDIAGEDVQAECTAEAHKGLVRVKFKKFGCTGVNVYTQLQGDKAWRFLALDTNSPYDDHTPLAQEGVPEVRLYHVVLVDKDVEVGRPSDTVTVTFAG